VFQLERFRAQHKGFAQRYIARWTKEAAGTGGSDFMPALHGYQQTTAASKLGKCPM
jgi:indoleamine 2,3-dioxygenase